MKKEAEKLLGEFWIITPKYKFVSGEKDFGDAFKYALLTVDKIIAVTIEDPYPRQHSSRDKQYWTKVKQHLLEMQKRFNDE